MNNYKQVKNYLHNDLGITKEYVDLLITQAVEDEVRKIFNNEEYIRQCIRSIIWQEVNKEMVGNNTWHTIHDMTNIIKDDINNAIFSEVKNRINISLKEEI